MNVTNPLAGSENSSHNNDHFYNVTGHRPEQILELSGFADVRVFPLAPHVRGRVAVSN
jgi:hypothetical protein